MPITINGSGSIAGISVGGLENGCVNESDLATAAVSNAKLAANAVTIDKMGTNEQSQLCKAWVNFNGTSTVAIRASYNVSSITDNGTGDYTVNFATAMADANYSALVTSRSGQNVMTTAHTYATGSVRVATVNGPGSGTGISFTLADCDPVSVAIFR